MAAEPGLGHVAPLPLAAAVGQGLAAAHRLGPDSNLVSQGFQQVHRGDPGLGVEVVHVAGHEQGQDLSRGGQGSYLIRLAVTIETGVIKFCCSLREAWMRRTTSKPRTTWPNAAKP